LSLIYYVQLCYTTFPLPSPHLLLLPVVPGSCKTLSCNLSTHLKETNECSPSAKGEMTQKSKEKETDGVRKKSDRERGNTYILKQVKVFFYASYKPFVKKDIGLKYFELNFLFDKLKRSRFQSVLNGNPLSFSPSASLVSIYDG